MTPEEAIKTIENRFNIMGYCEDEKLSDALDVAIEALEKQIPKEPIVVTWELHRCSNCNAFVIKGLFHKYCQRCGQAIKWEEE